MRTRKGWIGGLALLAAGCASPQAQIEQAVMSDDGPAVEAALQHGADVNATLPPRTPYSGDTLLVAAIQAGRVQSVPALLKGGADPNLRDASGYTPLHLAVASRSASIIEALLRAKADPNASYIPPPPPNARPKNVGGLGSNLAGQTPLMVAVGAHSARAVQLLLAHGAKPDQKDSEGRTAFWYARGALPPEAQAHLDAETQRARQMLLASGANPNPLDSHKKTPQQVTEREDEAEYLERAGRPLPPLDPEVARQVENRYRAARERLRKRGIKPNPAQPHSR